VQRCRIVCLDTTLASSYSQAMEIQLSPEREAQLNDYASRHGQDPATALDEVLRDALHWERQDYREAVGAIQKGYADFKAGRVRPLSEAFDELREKHHLPR